MIDGGTDVGRGTEIDGGTDVGRGITVVKVKQIEYPSVLKLPLYIQHLYQKTVHSQSFPPLYFAFWQRVKASRKIGQRADGAFWWRSL